MNTRNVALGSILILLLLAVFIFRGCAVQTEMPKVVGDSYVDASLMATPAYTDPPEKGWIFQGFTDRKSYKDGFEYSWGEFEHANGMKLIAMCSSPNSPDPKVGDEFYWDRMINILIPVTDNAQGTIQRFWYPSEMQ